MRRSEAGRMTRNSHAPAVPPNDNGTAVGADPDVFALPTSYAQERVWFLEQLAPGSAQYNVRRHEVLRTRFPLLEGRPVQVVGRPRAVRLPVVDLRAVPAGEREGVVKRHLRAEAGRPFDLARGPLLRARLLRVGEAEHILVL